MKPSIALILSVVAQTTTSIVGKYAFSSSSSSPSTTAAAVAQAEAVDVVGILDTSALSTILSSALAVFLMIFLNTIALNYSLKSMHHFGTFISLLVQNVLAYTIAGVAGVVVWNEQVSPTWYCGIGCLIIGTYLILGKPKKEQQNKSD